MKLSLNTGKIKFKKKEIHTPKQKHNFDEDRGPTSAASVKNAFTPPCFGAASVCVCVYVSKFMLIHIWCEMSLFSVSAALKVLFFVPFTAH